MLQPWPQSWKPSFSPFQPVFELCAHLAERVTMNLLDTLKKRFDIFLKKYQGHGENLELEMIIIIKSNYLIILR